MAHHPNILLIMTDQHAPHIAGFAGNSVVNTPALDNLAERSTCFDAAYCQSPLCVPSRMSMLVSKWAHRCSAWDNSSVLFPEHTTLPAWFSQHDYITAAVGKMHFRGREQMHGWQHRPYGDLIDPPFPFHQPDPPDTGAGYRWARHSIGRFPFAGATSIPESMLLDNVVTTESIAWLAEFTDMYPGKPWLFCASYSRPHFPLTVPGRYFRKYMNSCLALPPVPRNYPDGLHPHDRFIADDFRLVHFSSEEQRRALAAYYGCVEFVDSCIGRLLDELERLGCLEDTYVVYTTDHGDMAAEHGLWWKRTYYEQSARVPLLISGPGITGGANVSCPVELVDLFPTFCHWADIDIPSGLDGESLCSLLEAYPEDRLKKFARSELLGERKATQFRMIRDERWKLVEFPNAPIRLFDLENDPDELCDVAEKPPSDAPVGKLRDLLNCNGSWKELDAKRAKDRQPAGAIEHTGRGAAQYRLSDGRIIDADDYLYDGASAIITETQ